LSSLMPEKLLTFQHTVAMRAGDLKLCEMEPEVQEVFTTTTPTDIFDIRESEDDAIKAFSEDLHAKPRNNRREWIAVP
jgi:hypothetical protein